MSAQGHVAAEARARALIDAQLTAAGWSVQDRADTNLFAARGVAVREALMAPGARARRLPPLRGPTRRRRPRGQARGDDVSGVEWQSAMYATGDVARWGSGGTPRAGDSRCYESGTIPWAVIGDLDDGPLHTTARRITELGLQESAARWVPPGSVLVAMYGSIGKPGIPTMPLTTNQAIAFALLHPGMSRDYLFWFLRSQRSALLTAGKGGPRKTSARPR